MLPAKPFLLKTGQAILTTAALLVGYNLFAKAQASGRLNFYPASVTGIRFEGVTPVMTLGLAVQNVSNQRFVIRSIAGDVSANGYLVGNLSFFVPQTIQPNSSSTLLLDIRLSLLSVVNDIITAFSTDNFSQELILKGWANVDGIQAPLYMKYKVGK